MALILILILLWILYFAVHSVFASNVIKKRFQKLFPGLNRFYRLIYIFFSIAGLVIIFIYQAYLPISKLYSTNTLSSFIGLSLASFGLMIVILSFSYYDTSEFLGLRQARGDTEEQTFIRNGILNYVRHPLYSGSILFLAGYLILAPNVVNLVSVICMIIYFVLGSYFEEKKLIKTFGKDYLKYKSEVPPFVPNIGLLFKRTAKAKIP